LSLEEITIIALCLFGGYWGVSFLFDRRKGRNPERLSGDDRADEVPPREEVSVASSLSWPSVLGVSPNAGIDEIRHAYRLRMAEYHPDKVAALGAELRALAERKTKEINVAYDEACRARGERR
jgi:DnaJ like chaperone protein